MQPAGVANITTSIESARLLSSIETQREVLREEEEHYRALAAQRDEALALAKRCELEMAASEKHQAAMTDTLGVFESLLALAQNSFGASTQTAHRAGSIASPLPRTAKPIARLGRQHYFMLAALRQKGRLSVYDIAPLSGVDSRRVKQVMSADLDRDYVTLSHEGFSLTPIGLDILERFELFRRKEGKPLPSLTDKLLDGTETEADVISEQEIEEEAA